MVDGISCQGRRNVCVHVTYHQSVAVSFHNCGSCVAQSKSYILPVDTKPCGNNFSALLEA